MKFWSTFKLAVSSIFEHPMRSLLTSLGIIIGVAAVYAMLSLGEGAKREMEKSLNSVSSRTIQIWPNWVRGRRVSQLKPIPALSEKDVEEMRGIDGVFAATGNIQRSGTLATDNSDVSGNFLGVDPEYLKTTGGEMLLGDNISYADIAQSAPVVVISEGVMKNLYSNQNPIGQKLKVNNVAFVVKGVTLPVESDMSFGNDDLFAWAPISTARERVIGGDRFVRGDVRNIKVVGEIGADFDRINDEIEVILNRSRGIGVGDAPDYRLFSSRGWRQRSADSMRSITYLLAAMGGISLLVGGVGVMNIMLVSVTERTREIGLRMAVGARKSDILTQFMTEAVVLCSFGGLMGLAVGISLAQLPAKLGGASNSALKMAFSPTIALIAFGSAFFIGVVFGFLPARRASQMNPIEALRHE